MGRLGVHLGLKGSWLSPCRSSSTFTVKVSSCDCGSLKKFTFSGRQYECANTCSWHCHSWIPQHNDSCMFARASCFSCWNQALSRFELPRWCLLIAVLCELLSMRLNQTGLCAGEWWSAATSRDTFLYSLSCSSCVVTPCQLLHPQRWQRSKPGAGSRCKFGKLCFEPEATPCPAQWDRICCWHVCGSKVDNTPCHWVID